MVKLPTEFVETKYPGYFFNTADKKLYSLKVDGILKPLTYQKANRYNRMRHFDSKGGYRVSVNGQNRTLTIEKLLELKDVDSTIPVKIKEVV